MKTHAGLALVVCLATACSQNPQNIPAFDGSADGAESLIKSVRPSECEDRDLDGLCDDFDPCPDGPQGEDMDSDGIPDACDRCPWDTRDDVDNDGVCDSDDMCWGFDDNADADGDGFANGCDVCPGGNDADDYDFDSIPDHCDPCPRDGLNDSDADGVCDGIDVCLGHDDAVDTDADGVPDGCDICPEDRTNDSDGDGICDSYDVCQGWDDQADKDGDGVPNACDACPFDTFDDSDGDGTCDSEDICPGGNDRVDTDSDGTPDSCDPCPRDRSTEGICSPNPTLPGVPSDAFPTEVDDTDGGFGTLTFAADGSVVAAGGSSHSVVKLDEATGELVTVASRLPHAVLSVAVDPVTDEVLAGDSSGLIHRIDPDSGEAVAWADLGVDVGVSSIQFAPDTFSGHAGQIVVSVAENGPDTGKILVIDAADPTAITTITDGQPWISDLVFDELGQLFAAHYDTGEIVRYDASGNTTLVLDGLGGPDGVEWNRASQTLFVADSVNNELLEVGGGTVQSHGFVDFDSGWYPSGLLLDPRGELYLGTGESKLQVNKVKF